MAGVRRKEVFILILIRLRFLTFMKRFKLQEVQNQRTAQPQENYIFQIKTQRQSCIRKIQSSTIWICYLIRNAHWKDMNTKRFDFVLSSLTPYVRFELPTDKSSVNNVIKKNLKDISPFHEATDSDGLDFWWYLPWAPRRYWILIDSLLVQHLLTSSRPA